MTNDNRLQDDAASSPQRERSLPEAAQRALAEAAERRARYEDHVNAMPPERGGRGGQEPVRYGDWEVKGIATDF